MDGQEHQRVLDELVMPNDIRFPAGSWLPLRLIRYSALNFTDILGYPTILCINLLVAIPARMLFQILLTMAMETSLQ